MHESDETNETHRPSPGYRETIMRRTSGPPRKRPRPAYISALNASPARQCELRGAECFPLDRSPDLIRVRKKNALCGKRQITNSGDTRTPVQPPTQQRSDLRVTMPPQSSCHLRRGPIHPRSPRISHSPILVQPHATRMSLAKP